MKTCAADALKLVEEIIAEEIESLEEKDLTLLMEYREICVKKILPMLALEVSQIQQGEEWSSNKLEWSLKLAAFFEEPKAFSWVCELQRHSDTVFGELGFAFVTLYWPFFLALTCDTEWEKIKDEIEDPEIDEVIRRSCFEALTILVIKGKIDRSVIVEYFQSLYSRILDGELNDSVLVADLIEVSLDIWPGEFMEEIREIFGLNLIEDDYLELATVLRIFEEGKEEALEAFKDWIDSCHPLEPLVPNTFFEEEAMEELSEELIREMADSEELEEVWNIDDFAHSQEIRDLGGVVEFSMSATSEGEPMEIGNITRGAIPTPAIDELSIKDKRRYFDLYEFCTAKPEKAVDIAAELLKKHPEIPSLYFYLFTAYNRLDLKQQAMEVLRLLVDKFPEYILGRIEYANYLLRRGEPDKVAVFFNHAFTLSRLYPEKKAFYVLEWIRFTHVIGWYFLQMGMVEQAKRNLEILNQIAPESIECLDLKHKIQNDLLIHSFDDDLLNFDES